MQRRVSLKRAILTPGLEQALLYADDAAANLQMLTFREGEQSLKLHVEKAACSEPILTPLNYY
jgi:hypothetical protein